MVRALKSIFSLVFRLWVLVLTDDSFLIVFLLELLVYILVNLMSFNRSVLLWVPSCGFRLRNISASMKKIISFVFVRYLYYVLKK